MKKLIYGGATFASLFFLAMSCQKENVQPNPVAQTMQVVKTVKTDNSQQEKISGEDMRWFFDHGGDNYGCSDQNGNCFPDVVVQGFDVAVIDSLVDESDKGDDDGIRSTMSDNYNALSTYVPSNLLDGVINKTLDFKTKGDTTNTVYFLFYQNSNIVKVQPLTM